MNVRVGRMNTIIGNNGFIATARPLFSNDYQFFYSTTGTFTGFLTQLVVNDRLDVWNGMGLGANTFFTKRSDNSYCYIGQVNYWLQEEKRTRLTVSVNCGPDALPAAPGLNGDFVSIVELSLVQNWNERFTQVFQIHDRLGHQHAPRYRVVVRRLHAGRRASEPASGTPSSVPTGSATSRARGPASTPVTTR